MTDEDGARILDGLVLGHAVLSIVETMKETQLRSIAAC